MRIRNTMMLALGVSALALASGTAQAKKAQLIPIVPYPGATTTTVFGISDDASTIAGSYVDSSGNTHGFYGSITGDYTPFDFGTSNFTQGRALSGDGTLITGFSNNDGVHCDFQEWEMTVGGKIKQITKNGTPLAGEAQGINKKGTFAGDYCDTGGSGTIFGETGEKYKWKSDVTTPFSSTYTGERGINKDGTTVGFYVDSTSGEQVGTIIVNGTTTQVVYPDANQLYTVLEGINDDGLAAGQWDDGNSGMVRGFSYDSTTSTFTAIDDPNAASFTQPWGVNKSGLIAVTSDAGAYIYCALNKKKCPVTGEAPITIDVKTTHVAPAKMAAMIGAHKATGKQVLPKGAALQ
jgi:hypothetical protein